MPPFFCLEKKVETVLFIIAKTAEIWLDTVSFAMIIRMLLPIFFNPEDSTVYKLSFCISEPFILPVRWVMFKFNVLQNSPIDWSFTVSYLILILLRYMLPVI